MKTEGDKMNPKKQYKVLVDAPTIAKIAYEMARRKDSDIVLYLERGTHESLLHLVGNSYEKPPHLGVVSKNSHIENLKYSPVTGTTTPAQAKLMLFDVAKRCSQ